MTKTPFVALALAMALTGLSGALSAQTALKDVAFVREGIISAGMAYELSEKCSSVSARRIQGLNYLFGLRKHALNLGFTSAQVEAYVNDKVEEERLKQIAYGRLRDLGTVAGNEASYCAVARAEIAKKSDIGQLLR